MENTGAQQMRFRCAISALSTEDNQICVYCQDTSGGIREVIHDKGKWSGGEEHDVIARGVLGTPIATVYHEDDRMIHVFYVDERKTVRHVCRELASRGKWQDGSLNAMNVEVAPYSMMCGCLLTAQNPDDSSKKSQMRLFVQMKDNEIWEFSCDAKTQGHDWTRLNNLGRALPGTALACTCSTQGQDERMRLIYQDEHETLTDRYCRDPQSNKNWESGNLNIKDALPRTDLAVTSCDEYGVHVYYVDRDNHVREMCMEMQRKILGTSEKWTKGQFDQPCVAGSQVAAVSLQRHPSREWEVQAKHGKETFDIRLFFQSGHDVTAISEWIYNGKWERGNRALPPA